jgi:signal peptidase I
MPRQKSLFRTIFEPLALAIGLAVAVRAAVQIYSIPSPSMAPSLEVGDQIVVTPYFRSSPARGDVIVFRSPLDAGEVMVKRVIGVPGDLVDSHLGRVRIGGHTLPEAYVLQPAATGAISPQLIAAESYYVLGDNRESSFDSRSWGVVPRANVVGRAQLILWSSPRSPAGPASAHAGQTQTGLASTSGQSRLFKWIR